MSQQHSSEEVCSERVFNALKSHAEVTIQILDKILSSSNSVYSREYLTSGHLGSRVSLALTTLKLLEETEILSAADNTYSVNASQQYILSVKNQLHGYMYAKEEQDEPSFDLVMTTPKEPSILKKELLELPSLGAFNIHTSLLPTPMPLATCRTNIFLGLIQLFINLRIKLILHYLQQQKFILLLLITAV